MRIWHYKLLPYLPDAQFRGQLRELVAIMRAWRDRGKTNHLLINRVMEYPKADLWYYFLEYINEYRRRYRKNIGMDIYKEFSDFAYDGDFRFPFNGLKYPWHNNEYLRVCMANLYEKYRFGIGSSAVTEDEWKTLKDGYKTITGSNYEI